MEFKLTEQNVLSTVEFIVEGCRHHFERFGYIDDISYHEFMAQLQGIILLLIDRAPDSIVHRVDAAREEISAAYTQSSVAHGELKNDNQ
jgi:hypothetical protein